MQTLRRLFNFYIFSSIHVALGVFCFVKITLLTFGLMDTNTPLFTFFATILGYNFIRFLSIIKEKKWLVSWYIRHKPILAILSLISGLMVMYLSFSLRFEALIILTPFFVLTLFYGMKLPCRLINLRHVPGLKIFLIAVCFSGVTVLFPLVQNEVEISSEVGWYFVQRLLFVILITLPFDIRDVDFDSSQLKTIPQRLGIFNTKITGVALTGLILLIEYYLLRFQQSYSVIVLITCVLSILLLLFSSKKQSRYYSSFWVEAMPIIWYVFLLGLKL